MFTEPAQPGREAQRYYPSQTDWRSIAGTPALCRKEVTMRIVLQNLTKKFPSRSKKSPGEVIAVNDFTFEIPDGKLIGLLGPSGCGKSTALNLICGLQKPTEGKIFFGEDDVTNLPPEHRGVGLVFQSYALYPHLTVLKNITFPLENLRGADKLSKEEMEKRALKAAKLVQLEGLMDRKPSELSGGQQQRVAIARALYSFEEGYNSASQTFSGTGMYNYSYVLHDPYFLQAVKNTLILVAVTVPLSTGLALLISVALSSIKPLRDLFQTIYFLPYVTNTLAVGLVFMILFKKTAYSDGLVNLLIQSFGGSSVDFIDGPYWAKMFVLCFYTIWVVMPFKILILTSALASVNQIYYNAARVDGTPKWRIFTKITLPMISPMIFYLVITGFIGAFKAYSDAVALFGTDLNAAEMNTIVGYVYDMLYGDSGGYPSYASAAAIILFVIVLTITCINLLVSKKHVHY